MSQTLGNQTAATVLDAAIIPIVQPAGIAGGNKTAPIALFDARYARSLSGVIDPTNALDSSQGVTVGDIYLNTVTLNVFICIANGVGAAVWRHETRVIAQSGVAFSLTGTVAETIAATISLAAGLLGPNGQVDVETLWDITNSGNTKTTRFYLGAAGAGLGGSALGSAAYTTSPATVERKRIANLNSQVAQITAAGVGFGVAASANIVTAINTAAACEIVLSAQLASAGDTMALRYYKATLTRPDIT